MHEIKIKKGYSDGTLKLSPRQTIAKNKDFISWCIKDDGEVTSIENIEMKDGSTDIFIIPPHRNGDQWSAEIKDGLPDDTEYEYSITWNGKWGGKEYDPKISVNPSTFNFIKLLIGIILGFLGLLSLEFLRRKSSSK